MNLAYVLLMTCGLLSGFLAGLLGIGGGLIVVPALLYLLPTLGVDAASLSQVAVGTSLAAMIPTASCAAWSQRRRGTLDSRWVLRLTPGVAGGALLASLLAPYVDGHLMSIAFALLTIPLAGGFFRIAPPKAADVPAQKARWIHALPAWIVGGAIGSISALVGLGGANLTVPYLLGQSVGMRDAVGTSSAVVLVLAGVGAAGFAAGHPAHSGDAIGLAGLVCVPAAALVAIGAMIAVPSGVTVSHLMQVHRLRQLFGSLMLLSATAVLLKGLA